MGAVEEIDIKRGCMIIRRPGWPFIRALDVLQSIRQRRGISKIILQLRQKAHSNIQDSSFGRIWRGSQPYNMPEGDIIFHFAPIVLTYHIKQRPFFSCCVDVLLEVCVEGPLALFAGPKICLEDTNKENNHGAFEDARFTSKAIQYAKKGTISTSEWSCHLSMASAYSTENPLPARALHIVDPRHDPTWPRKLVFKYLSMHTRALNPKREDGISGQKQAS